MKLTLQDLSFSYTGTRVLEGINFEICPGELLVLVGPNGSGKSTVLKCITRILEAKTGLITLDGQDILRTSRRVSSRKIAYVSQNINPVFTMNVMDTVLLGRRPHITFRPSRRDLELVVQALETLGLQSFALRNLGELSGGEAQKVFIARALAQDAELLVLDEPTSNLDLRYQLEVMETLRGLIAQKNISVIIALHDLNLAARYADRVIMLSEGKVLDSGSPVTVLTSDNLSKTYGIRTKVKVEEGYPYIIPLGPNM